MQSSSHLGIQQQQDSSSSTMMDMAQSNQQVVPSSSPTVDNEVTSNGNVRDPIFPLWTRCTKFMHSSTTKAVTTCAVHAARNPKTYIAVITFLSFALAIAGFFVGFQLELDLGRTFTPLGSKPLEHHAWIEEEFPNQIRNIQLIFHNDGKDVLHKAQARRVLEAVGTIRNTDGFGELCSQGSYVNFENEPDCRILSVSGYWGHNITTFESEVKDDLDLRYVLSTKEFSNGAPIIHDVIIGNYQKDPDTGLLEEAQSYIVLIEVPIVGSMTDKVETRILENLEDLSEAWEEEVENTKYWTSETWPASGLSMDVMTVFAFKMEAVRAIIQDLYLVPISAMVMVAFTCLFFYRRDRVQSRCMLGIASILSICMSTLSGFGIMFLCQVPYSIVHQILPFIFFGIGLDDAFIITGAYFRTSPNDPIEARIQHTMEEAGWAISVTTATTMFAFILGYASTALPGVHWLCLYATTVIGIVYLYQITFFVAFMVLDERRVQANKKDICVWITVTDDDDDDDSNCKDESSEMADTSSEGSSRGSSQGRVSVSQEEEDDSEANKRLSVPDKAMRLYARVLLRRPVQIAVLVFFSGYFALCCYRATLMKQEFNVSDYVPKDSFLKNSFASFDQYSSVTRPMAVYFRNIDQTDPEMQQQMIDYIEELEELDQIGSSNVSLAEMSEMKNTDPIRSFCWVRDYQELQDQFRAETTDETLIAVLDGMTFLERLDFALSDKRFREVYGQDIVRDPDTGNITASRCFLFLRHLDLESVQAQIDMLADQREVAKLQPVNQDKDDWPFFAFEELFFYWEAYTVALDELYFTIVAGVVAISIISFILLPNYTAPFFVMPMILILYIELIGTFQMLGLHINALTYVCVVVSIGLLVDFLIHILLRYYETTGTTREARVKETLHTMGVSILVGGLTTLLGVMPLAISSLDILSTVFKGFFAMITLGTTHGLILLPVILSLVGPTATVRGHILPTEDSSAIPPPAKSDEDEVAVQFEKGLSKEEGNQSNRKRLDTFETNNTALYSSASSSAHNSGSDLGSYDYVADASELHNYDDEISI